MRLATHQLEELEHQRSQLLTEAKELAAVDELTDEQLERFEQVKTELEETQERHREIADLRQGLMSGRYTVESGIPYGNDHGSSSHYRGDPWQDPGAFESPTEMRSRSFAAIEQWRADDGLKEAATRTVERVNGSGIARHVLLTSDPAYVSAFHKHIADPETGVQEFTPEERAAWSRVKEYQRAALTLSGAVLPSPLDPTLILTNADAIDPMRRVARVDQTTSKSKRYVKSAGVTASFTAETTETSDDTPTLTEVEITVQKAQAFVQASIEAAMDQPDFASVEVARLFADAKGRLEATKFIKGTGTNEPKGIEKALDGGASELAPATAEVLAAADVYTTVEGLPPRWRSQAKWQAELSTLNTIHRFWNPSGSEPPLLEGDKMLRLPVVENSSIDAHSDLDATATEDNFLLFIGDWKQYVVLDRVGLTVEFIPHIFNTASNRPDGRRGWYAFWRVGGDVIDIDAFRTMSIPTTA